MILLVDVDQRANIKHGQETKTDEGGADLHWIWVTFGLTQPEYLHIATPLLEHFTNAPPRQMCCHTRVPTRADLC
jgi:hypothetical protein